MAAFQQISPGQKSKGFRCTSIPHEHVGVDHDCHCRVCALVYLALTVEQGKP